MNLAKEENTKKKSFSTNSMRLITDLNKIGKTKKKQIRDFIGVKKTKELIELAKQDGVKLGKKPKTQEKRAYRHFAEMFNDVEEEFIQIEKLKKKNEKAKRKADKKKFGKIYTIDDLEPKLLEKKPFKKMFKHEKDTKKPLSFTLISRVLSNVTQSANFTNYYHLKNWLENEKKFNDDKEITSNGETRGKWNLQLNGKNAWELFSIKLDFVKGGRAWGENKKTITRDITFLNYKAKAFDPATTNVGDNNCGIRVLSKLLDKKLNAKKIRKEINCPAGTLLNTEQLHNIYKQNEGGKKMMVIDPSYEGEFDLDTTDYILFKDNHYTAIIEATRQDHMEEGNKKQKGRLATG